MPLCYTLYKYVTMSSMFFCLFFTILNCPLLDPYPVKPFYNKSLAVTDSIQWHARSVSACKLGVGVYCYHFLHLSVFPPVYLSLTIMFFYPHQGSRDIL